jgi:Zn-dependent peptidase ImmA (M78 family)
MQIGLFCQTDFNFLPMSLQRIKFTASRKAEIEDMVSYVLEDYFPDQSLVKPEIIAEGEKIKFVIADYNKECRGLIEYKGGKFFIFLDKSFGNNLASPVIRYSFAHELGHYFINEHRMELMSQGVLVQADGDPMLSESIFEKEAEYFASCLLMPRQQFIDDVSGKDFGVWLIHKLCKKYKVSQTAALMRYMELGDEPIAVIFNHNNGRHGYKIQSPQFRHYHLNLDENGFIPKGSVAGRFCYERKSIKGDTLLTADVWFNPKNEQDALRIYREECLPMPNLNKIVSVVYEKHI